MKRGVGLLGVLQHPYTLYRLLLLPLSLSVCVCVCVQNKKENSCAYNTFPYTPDFQFEFNCISVRSVFHKQVYIIRKIPTHSIYMRDMVQAFPCLFVCASSSVNVLKIWSNNKRKSVWTEFCEILLQNTKDSCEKWNPF